MYLEKLELQGFKSFADKTTLEFAHGITVIVGPNGSGKSNVAESIRWVMGEQSMKALRMKKGEDVVFAGSSKRARSGFSEVSLHLNNEDRKVSVPWTHVVLGRRLYRSGESDYLINGNKVRLADVAMLLAEASFGARSYSVIGQGMIDQIILQSPEERKDFFDEAVGIRQFKIKKEQAENKLEATEHNLGQVEALLGEIEPRLRSLRRQVKKLEERKTLEEELHALQHIYYGVIWKNIETQYLAKRFEISSREKILTEKKNELEKFSKDLQGLEQKETKSSVFLRLQTEYQKALNERGKLRERQLELKFKLATQAEKKGTGPSVAELEPDLDKLDKLAEELVFLTGGAQTDIIRLKKLSENIRNLLQSVLRRIKGEVVKFPEIENELRSLEGSLKNLEETANELQEQQRNLAEEEKRERSDFFQTQNKLQAKQNELFLADRELNDIKIEIARLETKRDMLASEMVGELGERKDRVLREAENLEPTINTEEVSAKISKIKYQLSMIGGIDQDIINEFEETNKRYEFLSSQSEDIKKSIVSLRQVVLDLEETIGKLFDESFSKINNDFGRFFKVLFGGGEAKLLKKKVEKKENEVGKEDGDTEAEGGELEEEEATVAEDSREFIIEIQVSPPGKRIKSLHMLSGGEKALTSIALICAILSNNPSPFVALDEVDAALDESNAIRFARILEELSHKTQFIVVTHNRYTMENAKVLYGVTMGEDSVSRILSVKLEEALMA